MFISPWVTSCDKMTAQSCSCQPLLLLLLLLEGLRLFSALYLPSDDTRMCVLRVAGN